MPVSTGYNLLHEVFEKPQLPAGLLGNEAKNPVFAKPVFKADRSLRTTGYVPSYSDRRGSNENPKIIRCFFHLLSFAALPTLPGLCTIVINPVVNVIHSFPLLSIITQPVYELLFYFQWFRIVSFASYCARYAGSAAYWQRGVWVIDSKRQHVCRSSDQCSTSIGDAEKEAACGCR